jgi:hypothetical protein
MRVLVIKTTLEKSRPYDELFLFWMICLDLLILFSYEGLLNIGPHWNGLLLQSLQGAPRARWSALCAEKDED